MRQNDIIGLASKLKYLQGKQSDFENGGAKLSHEFSYLGSQWRFQGKYSHS